MKLVNFFVVLSCILFAGSLLNPLWAIDERYKAAPLSGNQISKDSSSLVVDTGYANWRPFQTTYSVQNLITFKVNELANIKLPDTFNVSVRFKIYYTRDAGGIPVQDSSAVITLNIGYNKNSIHDHMAIYTFKGGYSARVKITEVVVHQGTLSAFRNALMLENEILVNRNYTFSCTNSAVKAVGHNTATVAAEGELQVSWAAERTADEFDLEWTYIDTSALQYYKQEGNPSALDIQKLFNFNATRITVARNEYLIPLLYDSRGYLYYRVRAVQVKPDGQRIESVWSTNYLPQGLGTYEFTGHAETLNWQATTTFAEEGKRKSVVSYFDGSLRSRQTVTKDNTTDTSLIAETFYDYQGRPTIQVLPAPSLTSIINYTPNFNRAVNSVAYEKNLYDGPLAADNYCAEGAPPLDSATGTAKYYSSNNPLVNTSYHKYIPKASGFPFTETRYTPDNTGRISIQSGVGADFRIGTTHETRYFYSGADQEELDALFGTEVGNASHYFKNMVRDANGQYRVSYIDMHGRTIATALAGKPLSQLDTLTSSNIKTITKKLLDSNNNIIKGMVIESNKGLIVTRAGNQRFRYSLLPDSINIKDCNNIAVCYDCLYDLEITVSDECNNSSLPGGIPYRITATNLSLDTNCNANSFPAIDQTIFMREGSYLVSKRLTISKKGMDDYRRLFLRRNTCKTLDQFIAEQKQLLLNRPCAPTCNGCKDSLGTWETFRARYMREMNIPIADTPAHRAAAWDSYLKMQQECEALCNNLGLDKNLEQQMLADVTPSSGQYANPAAVDVYSIFYREQGSSPKYQRPEQPYLNENGEIDPLNPQNLSQDRFITEFKSSWATSLLRFHPEYWKLKRYKEFASSNVWDERFGNTETYQEAVAKGWLNPASFTGLPSNPIFNAANAANADPFFTTLAPQHKAAMQQKLHNYYTPEGEGSVSAWSLATIMAHCKEEDNTCRLQFTPLNMAFAINAGCTGELDMAWKNFRELYRQAKREIIDQELLNYHNANSSTNLTYLTSIGYNLNFPDPNYDPRTDGSIIDTKEEAAVVQAQFISNNCGAYAQLWWDELKPCNYNTNDTAWIFPRLRQVCMEGGDSAHVFGSSTLKPSSTYQYRSFEDVLKAYDINRYNATCNAYLITAPKPYDQQPVYFDKPVYQKPDSCECATISSLYGKYQLFGQGGTFSDYIYLISKTRIHEGVLDTLRKACNGEINCNFLKEPLSLPPILQCGVKNVCADCTGVDSVYDKFKLAFPGITPTTESTDSTQQERNKLFENFMNHHLGFSKPTSEYLSFINACGGDTSWRNVAVNISDNLSCDSVNYLYTNFQCIYNTMNDEDVNAGKCIESIWAATGRLNGNPAFSFLTGRNPAINTHVKDGVFYMWPDTTLTTITNATFMFVPQAYWATRPLSAMNNMSYEFRVRAPSYNTSGARINNTLSWFCSNNAITPNPSDPLSDEDFIVWVTESTAGGKYQVYGVDHNAPELNNRDLGNWHTIKFDLKDSTLRVYYDGTILKEIKRDGKSWTITNTDFRLGFSNGAKAAMDWFRITRHDTTVYFEDFNGPSTYPFSRPDPKFLMPILPCERLWREYFNALTGKSLTNEQIRAYYWKKCHIDANPCPDTPLTLCGKTDPVFPPVSLDQRSTCDDSTLFSVSKGTLLYEAYRDSITDHFNDRYMGKCLNARYHETFTVEQQINEFHYTLYYYDQAGNLVKTIPPAGVNVSKFGWAVSWSDSVRTARKNKQQLTPVHGLRTDYRYNSLNQVVAQQSPDGGKSEFWYDRLGRLGISQNAKQKAASTNEENRLYSYTHYDLLGRINEVGQVRNTSANGAMTDLVSRNENLLITWLQNLNANREQITSTIYDDPYPGFAGISNRLVIRQRNLRNRVSFVTYTDNNNPTAYNQATFYTYDVLGNVDTLLQDYGCGDCGNANTYNVMNRNGNRWKKITYQYDLISGKVNMVMYNRGWGDQFFHRYRYDAENRITLVETSLDSLIWEKDARYEYYRHGPLARTVLGEQLVQGIDYAYTLQGWLKGVNSTGGMDLYDMGNDGKLSGLNQFVARDAFAFNLNYFAGDYTTINNGVQPFPNYSARLNTAYRPLYNGNISSLASYIKHFDKPSEPLGGALFYNYRYDQLNRLTGMDAYNGFNRTSNNFDNLTAIDAFKERISFDANGNILTLNRNGDKNPLAMDSLTYTYYPGTNRLRRVADKVPATNYGNNSWDFIFDIDNQDSLDNYVYDEIGNLIQDKGEKITNIKWNVYGKIQEITRVATDKVNVTKINYTYDAAGNRISKVSDQNGTKQYTWYVRDAQGNLLTTYAASGNNTNLQDLYLSQNDRYLYGSSRLGMYSFGNAVDGGPWDAQEFYTSSQFHRGWKQYELSNHLGNVMATISDRKIPVSSGGSLIDYYEPDLVSAQDYYPFGMMSRLGTSTTGQGYRFGFNGKEFDWEAKGWGNQYDYGMRIYDNRIGRFLSVDPLTDDYPGWSPYPFAMNRPIDGIDLDGLEWAPTQDKAGNIIDFKYAGFDDKGNPKPGTIPRGILQKGDNTYLFGNSSTKVNSTSDVKISSATIDVLNNKSGEFYHIELANKARAMNVENVNLGNLTTAQYRVEKGTTNTLENGFEGLGAEDLYQQANIGKVVTGYLTRGDQPGTVNSDGLGPLDFVIGIGELRLGKPIRTLLNGGLEFAEYKAARGGGGLIGEIDLFVPHKYYGTKFPVNIEYHHRFITSAMQRKHKLPNWLVNNWLNIQKTNTLRHAQKDIYRYWRLPAEIKRRLEVGDLK